MLTWWHGAALVFRRAFVENLRSKTFRMVTALLLLASAAAVVVPGLVGGGPQTYTLATVGRASTGLVAALDSAGRAGGFEVRYITRTGDEQLRAAVRKGDATVGLTGARMYVATRDAGTFPAVVAQAVVTLETARELATSGLTREQIVRLQGIRPPEQVAVAPVQDESRVAVGFAVGLAVYVALVLGGNAIATAVATEKSSRISEVLLAVLRPSQVLAGTVLAYALVTLIQLLVLGGPVAVAVQVRDDIGLPAVATGDIALAIMWFVLGFALYATLYAASGALVERVTEVSSVQTPLSMIILVGYFVGYTTIMGDPNSGWSVLVSLFPLTAPLAMPFRWATGEVPVYQLVLAMGLTAATAVAAMALASVIYRRALVVSGRRVRLRDVIGASAAA
jgi:ABC-2 type transport system permease protein